MVTQWVFCGLLTAVALERGLEVWLSARNARWSFARGGIEVGQRHFGAMKALHVSFFVAAAAEVLLLHRPWIRPLGISMAVAVLAAQGLRYWAILTLGKRWNTRVIVVPGATAVATGPYRWLRHPNYVAVIVEGVAVPLLHSAYLTALAFTLLNAWLLSVRIGCEEQALRLHCEYDQALAQRRALLPRLTPAQTRHG